MTRLEQLEKLTSMTPNDPMAHYGLGLEFVNQQRWPEAVAAFDRAMKVDPKYSAAYYHKARAEIAAGLNDAARATLNDGMRAAQQAGDWHTEGEMRELLESIV